MAPTSLRSGRLPPMRMLPSHDWNEHKPNSPDSPVSPQAKPSTGPGKLLGCVAVFYDRTVPEYLMPLRIEPKLRLRGDDILTRISRTTARDAAANVTDIMANLDQVRAAPDQYSGVSRFFVVSNDETAPHAVAELARSFPGVEVALITTKRSLGNGVWIRNHLELEL